MDRLAIALLLTAGALWGGTPLDDYVAKPDAAYRHELVRTIPGEGFTAQVHELVSQRWTTPTPADRELWTHWLILYVPDDVPAQAKQSTALLFINGGSNASESPTKADETFAKMAVATKTIVADLKMVPNQPLSYPDDDFGLRKEDELISHNWKQYLDGGDPQWLTRLPMTKSAVRAMDAVTEITEGAVEKYFVMGASKRGWTTWTTAAVDERVVGIAPLVIDMLNVVPSFVHHYRVYGFWAPAVGDYFREGLMDRSETTEYARMMEIVEPYSYRDRYTMPKYLVHGAGDQFFLPDSSQFYFEALPGEKYLRYVPNTDHSLRDSDAVQGLIAFYDAVAHGKPRPRFRWSFGNEGAIRVETGDTPAAVKLWTAHNPEHRDFRLENVGKIWKSAELTPDADGSYLVQPEMPEEGFLAYFVELTYESGIKDAPFKFTTGVRVTPDRYDYPRPVPGKTAVGPKKR